jgi:hypothetical protein
MQKAALGQGEESEGREEKDEVEGPEEDESGKRKSRVGRMFIMSGRRPGCQGPVASLQD